MFEVQSVVALVLCAFCFSGCASEESEFLSDEARQGVVDYSDYIVVANATGKSVVLLTPNFSHVADLLLLPKTSADIPIGLALRDQSEVLVTIEGVDRVMSTSIYGASDSATNFILDTNLAGTPMRGIAVLSSGDVIVSEGATMERFSSAGTRVTTSGWPKSLQTGGTQITPLTNGGFLHCSNGTNVVRSYDSAGVQVSTVVSGIVGTTTVSGCAVGSAGQVAVAYYGTTDTIRVYTNSTLSVVKWSFSDTTLLGNPQALGVKSNGNVVVIDGTSNLAVELDALTGVFVRSYSSSAINGVSSLLVLP